MSWLGKEEPCGNVPMRAFPSFIEEKDVETDL